MKGAEKTQKYSSPFSKMFKQSLLGEEYLSVTQNISDLSTHLQASQLKNYTDLNLS